LEERSVSTDDQDIFDSEVPEAPQTTEGVSPEAPAGPVRDEAGRFAPKDTGENQLGTSQPKLTTEDISAPEPGAPPAPAATRHDVPLTALLDERDKRKALEAEIARYQAQLRQFQAPPQTLPDPTEDAEGYTRGVVGSMQQQLQAAMLRQSEFLARREFGAEVVDEVLTYLDQNPRKSHEFLGEPSPFHAAVEWFKEQKASAERASPDFEARLRAKLRAEWEAEQVAEVPRPNIPRSLASAPSASGAPPMGEPDPIFG
jgi:hypothetical protein